MRRRKLAMLPDNDRVLRGMLLLQAVDQVQLGADGPLRARWGGPDRLNN